MFCIHCGANNQHEGKFCFQCGKPLVVDGAPESADNEQPEIAAVDNIEIHQQTMVGSTDSRTQNASASSETQNFFSTVWKGEWGLAKTYWFLVPLGNAMFFASGPSMKAGMPPWVLMGVIASYHIWAFVGIWRAASKYQGLVVWRHLSRAATLLGAMFLIAGLAVLSKAENTYTGEGKWSEVFKGYSFEEDGSSSRSSYFADPSTIRKAGNKATIWVLHDYEKEHKIGDVVYTSEMSLMEYSCEENKYRELSASYHSGNMGSGKMVFRKDAPSPWASMRPYHINQRTFSMACELAGGYRP